MSGIKPTGRHLEKRLTAAGVRALTEPGLHGDGHGLYLKVDSSGAKRWIQRIVINGKRRDIGLGSASLKTLAAAREEALDNRRSARNGVDPIAARRPAKAVPTFSEAMKSVHHLHLPNWKSPKQGPQWLSSLEIYAIPHIGSKPVSEITSQDIATVLSPIWTSKPETARKLKQRLGIIMEWSIGLGWRLDNPVNASMKSLPKPNRTPVHRQALPYDQVGGALQTIRNSEAGLITKLAFEFLVLTATRSGETREAVWSEFDLSKAVWTIPAARMKAKKAHRVPLPARCLAILEEAKAFKRDDDDLVFPGTKAGKPLSDMTLSKLMKDLGIAAVPHGFRSSFRDWAGESTAHPREVIEFALAHVIRDKAEAAYARSDLFDKRRILMADWCEFTCQQRSIDAQR